LSNRTPPTLSPFLQITEKLELTKLFRGTDFLCQGCVGTTGSGLYEGLDWLATTLSKRLSKKATSGMPSGYS